MYLSPSLPSYATSEKVETVKQVDKTIPSVGGYDTLSGNAEAKAAADKIKAAIDAIPVDQDALLRAERNDVLDAAIARLEGGEKWISSYIAWSEKTYRNVYGDWICEWVQKGNASDTINAEINAEAAAHMRATADKFCLVGTIGAEEGLHSRESIEQALDAVARVAQSAGDRMNLRTPGYGYRSGNVFSWNDDQRNAEPVIAAMKAAKHLPLTKWDGKD